MKGLSHKPLLKSQENLVCTLIKSKQHIHKSLQTGKYYFPKENLVASFHIVKLAGT